MSDDVVFSSHSRGGVGESAYVESAAVQERGATKVEVADDLPDRRPHEEAVAREPRGVQEPRDLAILADELVVVWSDLIEAGPSGGQAGVQNRRGAALDEANSLGSQSSVS